MAEYSGVWAVPWSPSRRSRRRTFSLTPEQSLKLAYAESFSKKVRLLLRRDGDQGTAQTPEYSANPGTPAQGAN